MALMREKARKHKRWLGYILYSLLLTGVLLYVLFPSNAFRDYLVASVEKGNPDWSLSIETLEPTLTLGMKVLGMKVSLKGEPEGTIFEAERVLIRPGLWSLLHGEPKLSFKGLAYGGGFKGRALFGEGRLEGPLALNLELKDMHIEKHKDLLQMIGRRIEGGVNGTLTYTGKAGSPMEGEGEADLRLSSGEVTLLQPLFGLQAIDFDELWVKLLLRNRQLELNRAELKGPNLRGTVSGRVILRRELMQSGLDLKGTVEPLGEFHKSLASDPLTMKFMSQRLKGGKLFFAIQGDVDKPRLRFL
jgi:type II secretion system protein N